ncbi:unnamed protein product [Darwinula stevensoni]|uniref:STAS domain-containing protein n=1 Tax=Darwinula stevensoni TaxID=69355 RepID=A0A7R8X2U0_9CRUS|nr:unnamed protein product [Darwinula stevensoni]CAG0883708.1 unnamed protein product [Darwinula stevensoni]
MGVLRLGSLTVFLSDTLVSAFTTGAAVHVATSQIRHVFGLLLPRHDGPLKIVLTYRDFFPMIMKSNMAAVVMSFITMFVLVCNNDYLKPCLAKSCRFPVPIELICVVIGTVASYGAEMDRTYNLSTVGYLPTGLPGPRLPPLWLMGEVDFMIQCLVIAIVSYSTSISLAKLFARKAGYQIFPNQELLATIADLKKAWRVSKLDAFVWVMTFLSVTLIDIDYGLAIGVASSLFTLIWRNQRAYACVLGHIPNSGIYVDIRRFYLAKEEEDIKILHYGAGIHFGNREAFKLQVYKLTQLEPEKWEKEIEKKKKQKGKMVTEGDSCSESKAAPEEVVIRRLPFRHLILDLTGVSFIDASGISTLVHLITEYQNIGVQTYFTGVKEPQLKMFRRMEFFGIVPLAHFFPTVSDAVLHCTKATADFHV